MSTIVELERRLQTLDALRHEMRRTVDEHTMQLRALEAWNREGGVLYNIGTKLSNLEDQHEEDRTTIYGQLTEIEEQLSQLDMSTITAAVKMLDTEQQRQARWHATYNAALNYALSITYQHVQTRSDHIARAHEYAAEHADRAHGPLEGKVEGGKVFMTAVGPLTVTQWDEKVSALVKVARKASDFLREGAADECDMGDELAEALKPFEVTR